MLGKFIVAVLVIILILVLDISDWLQLILSAVVLYCLSLTTSRVVNGGLEPSMHQKSGIHYTVELKNLIDNNLEPSLSHIPDGTPLSSSKPVRTLDLSQRLKYTTRTGELKRALHWGQLKLLLSEIEFLSKVLELHKSLGSKLDIYFVYAGAAPGDHAEYLHSLFPTVYFELYDPNKFVAKDGDRFKTHQQFFTDSDARQWAKRQDIFLVFCSDIRSEPPTDENITRNMDMQLNWWKIMRPQLTMFKFRLLWKPGKTVYPEGDIYLQIFPGPSSSETRLIVKQDAKLIDYDNIVYEEACFNHNVVNRSRRYPCVLGDNLSILDDGFDNCYDCVSMVNVVEDYLTMSSLDHSPGAIRAFIKKMMANTATHGTDIKFLTKRHLADEMDKNKRLQYVPCSDRECLVCYHRPALKKTSKATVENEIEYLKRVV